MKVRVESDYTVYGDECRFGGGKVGGWVGGWSVLGVSPNVWPDLTGDTLGLV